MKRTALARGTSFLLVAQSDGSRPRLSRMAAWLRQMGERGGFEHGGWHTRYFDDLSMSWVVENVSGAGGYLLGRGTYEMFAAHWPNAAEEEQMLAEPLNTLPKYVASTTLAEPLEWQNSALLRGDIAQAVAALKAGTSCSSKAR